MSQLSRELLRAYKSSFRIASREAVVKRLDGETVTQMTVDVATFRHGRQDQVVGEVVEIQSSLIILHSELIEKEFPLPIERSDQIVDRGVTKTVDRVENLEFGETIFAYRVWVNE